MEWYRRLRHTYGFGVHSPFAYMLVKEVVRPGKVAWYGYADIDAAMAGNFDLKVRRESRMLLRLVCCLRPESVFLPLGIHPAYHAALAHADSRTPILRKPKEASKARMICTHGEFVPEHLLAEALQHPGAIVAIRDAKPGWADRLFDSMKEGLLIRGKRNAVLFCREGMRKVSYTMRI